MALGLRRTRALEVRVTRWLLIFLAANLAISGVVQGAPISAAAFALAGLAFVFVLQPWRAEGRDVVISGVLYSCALALMLGGLVGMVLNRPQFLAREVEAARVEEKIAAGIAQAERAEKVAQFGPNVKLLTPAELKEVSDQNFRAREAERQGEVLFHIASTAFEEFKRSLRDPEGTRWRDVYAVKYGADRIAVCGVVNARNAFGAFVGETFFIANLAGSYTPDDPQFAKLFQEICIKGKKGMKLAGF